MRDKATGFYKIGQSGDPGKRLKDLCRQDTKQPHPNEYELIEAWWAYDRVEFELHHTYRQKRHRGEWFALTDSDVLNIRRFFLGHQPYSSDVRDDVDSQLKLAGQDNVRLRHLLGHRNQQILERFRDCDPSPLVIIPPPSVTKNPKPTGRITLLPSLTKFTEGMKR